MRQPAEGRAIWGGSVILDREFLAQQVGLQVVIVGFDKGSLCEPLSRQCGAI